MKMGEDNEIDYKCSLSKEAQKIAFEELREDENTRSQALEQFRAWILKHPSIKRCRTDPVFLLRFLRTKKFSLPMAQEMLEHYLQARQSYSGWFQNLDINDPDLEAIIDNGYIVLLLEKDQHRRQVIFSCPGRFDPYKYTAQQMVRAHTLAYELAMSDEENQVHGYTHVYDETGLSIGHLGVFSFAVLRNLFRWVQYAIPMRHKMSYIINIPNYATKVLDFTLSLLNNKIRQRTAIYTSIDDLKKAIDPKILPKEYGGDVPLSDMIAAFKDKLRKKRDEFKALDDMHIEILPKDTCSSVFDDPYGISGSFRKLEVD